MKFVKDFHLKEVLTKACTSSLISLILKVKNPQSLVEYRLIGLVGTMHKILSKLLAGRLKEVINCLISTKQNAFIKNRSILDGVVVVNEVLDLAKREGVGYLILKDDYEKAYDCVSWDFLRNVMKKMGFGMRWLRWMKPSVFTSHIAIIIKGSCMNDFKVERGLRQGDIISPLLFVIVMEGLTRLMEKAVELGEYMGFNFGGGNEKVDITHFADDTIIFDNGDIQNLWSMKVVFRGYEFMSGLKVNFFKSNIYGINLSKRVLDMSPALLTCGIGTLPFKFLGIMVDDNPRKIEMWKEVINDVRRCLEKWRGRFLSIGGRVMLINSVLNTVSLYLLSFYRFPKKVLKEIISI